MRWCFEGLVLLACRVWGWVFLGLKFLGFRVFSFKAGFIKKFYRKKIYLKKNNILLYIVKICIPP